MKKIFVILILLFLCFSLHAQTIPNSFDAGEVISAAAMNENFNMLLDLVKALSVGEAPIGTVIASMLDPVEMFSTAGDRYVLADGSAATAEYIAATGDANLPDLRGVFLRGLNESRGDGYEDPAADADSRDAGEMQMDQFQGHRTVSGRNGGSLGEDGISPTSASQTFMDRFTNQDYIATLGSDGTNGTPRTGLETRPTNAAVYYYIKVK